MLTGFMNNYSIRHEGSDVAKIYRKLEVAILTK